MLNIQKCIESIEIEKLFLINMYNYILIILYGISDIFSPKKFALLRNLTSIFQKYALLYFQINKLAIYSLNELKISK